MVLSICASMSEHPRVYCTLYKENMDVRVYILLYIIAKSQHCARGVWKLSLYIHWQDSWLARQEYLDHFFYFAKLTRSNCAAK
jgi:hypothetical protein